MVRPDKMLDYQDELKREYVEYMIEGLERIPNNRLDNLNEPFYVNGNTATLKSIYLGKEDEDDEEDDIERVLVTFEYDNGYETENILVEDFGMDEIHSIYEIIYYKQP